MNTSECLLDAIFYRMRNETFSKDKSAKIVGGMNKLRSLIADGKIEAVKRNAESQNGKWYCNAAQVLRYAKVRRV